jgi:hypothetical protein
MAHHAAIYTVRLKKTRRGVDNDFRYFGDPAGDQSLPPIVEVMSDCFGVDRPPFRGQGLTCRVGL